MSTQQSNVTVTISIEEYEMLKKRASDNQSSRHLIHHGRQYITVYDNDNQLIQDLMNVIKDKDDSLYSIRDRVSEMPLKDQVKNELYSLLWV